MWLSKYKKINVWYETMVQSTITWSQINCHPPAKMQLCNKCVKAKSEIKFKQCVKKRNEKTKLVLLVRVEIIMFNKSCKIFVFEDSVKKKWNEYISFLIEQEYTVNRWRKELDVYVRVLVGYKVDCWFSW